MLVFCTQSGNGGGLYIGEGGVANLEGCNVYSNEAEVSARLTPIPDLTSSAPLERYARALAFLCSILAAGSTSTLARPTSMAAMCTAM